MLVSQMDVLAQDLRRQDLLTQTLFDRVALDRSSPTARRAPAGWRVRQAVGTVLVQTGERLRTSATPETMAEMG